MQFNLLDLVTQINGTQWRGVVHGRSHFSAHACRPPQYMIQYVDHEGMQVYTWFDENDLRAYTGE